MHNKNRVSESMESMVNQEDNLVIAQVTGSGTKDHAIIHLSRQYHCQHHLNIKVRLTSAFVKSHLDSTSEDHGV